MIRKSWLKWLKFYLKHQTSYDGQKLKQTDVYIKRHTDKVRIDIELFSPKILELSGTLRYKTINDEFVQTQLR